MNGQTFAQRFWAKTDKSGGTDACWIWTAARSCLGYGDFRLRGQRRPAHLVEWELANGPPPDGIGHHRVCVLHRCDNRACVNPDHLFLGTHLDNMRDMATKGRSTRGERSGRAKLTAVQVLDIRSGHLSGVAKTDLASQFGVSVRAISHVVTGDGWSHVPLLNDAGQFAFAWRAPL